MPYATGPVDGCQVCHAERLNSYSWFAINTTVDESRESLRASAKVACMMTASLLLISAPRQKSMESNDSDRCENHLLLPHSTSPFFHFSRHLSILGTSPNQEVLPFSELRKLFGFILCFCCSRSQVVQIRYTDGSFLAHILKAAHTVPRNIMRPQASSRMADTRV